MIKGKGKEASSTENWEVTAKRFVGFIDIMGFKDMVFRKSNKHIYDMMLRLKKALIFNEDLFGKDRQNKTEGKFVTMTTYSDSIMVYSKDSSETSFSSFISTISSLHEDLLNEQIPHKGAIAFGEMTLDFDKSIYFGQPLIDSYLLQEELQFYGIVCHASAEERIPIDNSENYLYPYNCHFKTGKALHYTVCPLTLDETDNFEKPVKAFRNSTSGSLRKYIDNTLEYLQVVRQLMLDEERS